MVAELEGAQMFKEARKRQEVFIERIEEALDTKADIVASSCPFCMTMLTTDSNTRTKKSKYSTTTLSSSSHKF